MSIGHGYDWAWAQIPSTAVTSNGGSFVVRYLGGSARLTPQERDNHFAAGVKILLVMEQEATLAEGGYDRGVSAARQANDEADGLGYPVTCTIFYADDNNDPDTSQEVAFMQGVKAVGRRPSDMYSGGNVLVALGGLSEHGGWMVDTWYPNAGADPALVQLANTRDPAMVGVDPSQYDTNLLLKDIPMWGPSGTSTGGAAPAPAVTKDDHVVYDETTASGAHQYWVMSPNGLVQLLDATAYAHLTAHDTFVPVSTYDIIDLGTKSKPKPATVTVAAPDTHELETKLSVWFGALQDHVDAKVKSIPAPPAGAPQLADIQKVVHTELSKLGIAVKP